MEKEQPEIFILMLAVQLLYRAQQSTDRLSASIHEDRGMQVS